MDILDRKFFERPADLVAKELLGKILVRKTGRVTYVGKIVETEAYLGELDKASHSSKGKTKRNEVMFGEGGHAYVYFTYGMHWLLNFVTETEGHASGVLIRAVEPIAELCGERCCNFGAAVQKLRHKELRKMGSGPARLTKWMRIDGDLNKTDITRSDKLFVVEKFLMDGINFEATPLIDSDILATTRIGVDYAGESKKLPLRFYISGNPFVSKK